jgi:hypothetical protein
LSEQNNQQYQLERLISLSEQANERSQGVEAMIRQLGWINDPAQVPGLSQDLEISKEINSRDEKRSRTSLSEQVRNSSTATPATRLNTDCICGNSATPLGPDSFHISRNDLDIYARHLRALLNMVEGAQLANDGSGQCETVTRAYRSASNALSDIFPVEPKRASGLRRLFAKRTTKFNRLGNRNIAPANSGSMSNPVHSQQPFTGASIKPSATLPPQYNKIYSVAQP